MALRIVTAEKRQAEARGIKVVITGRNGIGKTNILAACSLPSGLFLDREKPGQGGNS